MKTPQQQIVSELIAKFPEHGSQTLARMAYKASPQTFATLDSARCAVRRERGSMGGRVRKYATAPKPAKPRGFDAIPTGIKELGDWIPHEIQAEKLLVVSDIHAPFHDKEALVAALKHGKKEGCDTCLINGDFADFFAVSFWEKDPRLRNLANEIAITKEIQEIIAGKFERVIWKLGNHEERWERYLKVKAPELLGVPEFTMQHHFRHDQYTFVSGNQLMKFGKLFVVHGHEFGKSVFNPVNAARGYFLRGNESMLAGHYHHTSEHATRTMGDSLITTWSTGCLCDLHPGYAPMNKWNHGAAIVERLDDKGSFWVKNFKIISGRVY